MTEYNGETNLPGTLLPAKLVTHAVRFSCINYEWNKLDCQGGTQSVYRVLYVNIEVICLWLMCQRILFLQRCVSPPSIPQLPFARKLFHISRINLYSLQDTHSNSPEKGEGSGEGREKAVKSKIITENHTLMSPCCTLFYPFCRRAE